MIEPRVELRLLGGVRLVVEGETVSVPSGAATVALAIVALYRVVHVEEVTAVLWPEAEASVGRRRLRNVLTRIRGVGGTVILRYGDRLELAPDVSVDHHRLDQEARRVLASPLDASRRTQLREVLAAYSEPFLPELLYEEWAQPARERGERRRDELRRALEAAGPG